MWLQVGTDEKLRSALIGAAVALGRSCCYRCAR